MKEKSMQEHIKILNQHNRNHSTYNKRVAEQFFNPVQPKLTINQPNDIYEQEADAVADKVMRMSDKDMLQTRSSPVTIQTKCADCEEEEKMQLKESEDQEGTMQLKPLADLHVQRKCEHCEEEKVQLKANDNKNDTLSQLKQIVPGVAIQRKCADCEEEEKMQLKESPYEAEEKQVHCKESGYSLAPATTDSVYQAIHSAGKPLDNDTRVFMERRFNYDFGEVRIHDDGLAHQSTKDINAKAYTHGRQIVFGSGEYQPNTDPGKKLLAHELTHVIQQNTDFLIQRDKGRDESEIDPMTEIETLLARRFSDSNDPELAKRRKRLGALFFLLDAETGSKLYKRLIKPVKGDKLAESFGWLARETRKELLSVLLEHVESLEFVNSMTRDKACKPFTKEEIEFGVDFNAMNGIDHFINVDVRSHYGNETADVLDEYQQRRKGDSLTPKIFDKPGGEIVRGFMYNSVTKERELEIVAALEKALQSNCPALPENTWTLFELTNFLPSKELDKEFSFTGPTIPTIPGILAGGVGMGDVLKDSRSVSGKFELFRSAGKIRIRTNFHFVIKETFDFCPGDLGGPIAQIFTIPMSRLEASDMAYDVPFEVHYDGPKFELDLSADIITKCFTK